MSNRKIFISRASFEDAIWRAKLSGYQPVGQARNKRGEFVIFAEPIFGM